MTTLSVLIPAFNAGGIIDRCLASLDNQSVAPDEIIVVDDGSADDTAAAVSKFENVKLVSRSVQGGAGAARATAAKAAKGDILAFIDTDCEAPPDWIERIKKSFESSPELGAVGGMYRHYEAGTLVACFGKFEEEYLHHVFALSPDDSALTGGNFAVRRAVWEECRTDREIIYFPCVASTEDTVVAQEIRALFPTRFDRDIYVRHQPKDSLKGFIKRNMTRARTRMVARLANLVGRDNVLAGFGGWRLVFSAIALWAAVLSISLVAVLPGSWAVLGVATLVLVGAHFWLASDFFAFVHSNHERPGSVQVGPLRDLGLRALVAVRTACWVLGALIGVMEFAGRRMRHYWNVIASILHFWRPGRISKLFYFVTSKCNARCSFCFNLENVVNWKERQKVELTLDEVEKLTCNFGRLPYLTLSGGEPFARPDLPQVIAAFRRNSHTQWVTIPTNGALTRRTLEAVREILVNCPDMFLTIQFSIDSLFEAHDESRKINGGFQAMVETARRLSHLRAHFNNLRIQINTPYDDFNLENLDRVRAFCNENLEFDQHFFYLFREEGELISDKNVHLADSFLRFVEAHDTEAMLVRGKRLWDRAVRALQSVTYDDTRRIKVDKEYLRPCHATQKFATLYDDGSITPCEVLDKRLLGNVRNHNFDFYQMKKAIALDDFHRREILDTKCNCEWMCATPMNMLYHPPTWLRIARQLFRSPPKAIPVVQAERERERT